MITQLEVRQHYLEDLQRPDTFHGRQTPKVRNPVVWSNITSVYRVGEHARPSGKVWVWSDIHFFHKNIIKYTYPHRPYATVEDMHEAIIANYIDVVRDDDITIWCGDISFGGVEQTNNILQSLPGYKIQIVGNHDIKRDGRLLDYAFDERHLCLLWPCGQTNIIFTHFPLDSVPHACHNIHGHIHQNLTPYPWSTNVSLEHTGCAPKLLTDIIDTLPT